MLIAYLDESYDQEMKEVFVAAGFIARFEGWSGVEEAAKILGVNPKVLSRWAAARRIPHVDLSEEGSPRRCIRFDPDELDLLIKKRTKGV